ncbi:MAG TPA: hypothetical protein VJY65_13695 [Chloroflexota bacterium]|nr:hypothetical protein [Chloroflexota bacterium]
MRIILHADDLREIITAHIQNLAILRMRPTEEYYVDMPADLKVTVSTPRPTLTAIPGTGKLMAMWRDSEHGALCILTIQQRDAAWTCTELVARDGRATENLLASYPDRSEAVEYAQDYAEGLERDGYARVSWVEES